MRLSLVTGVPITQALTLSTATFPVPAWALLKAIITLRVNVTKAILVFFVLCAKQVT